MREFEMCLTSRILYFVVLYNFIVGPLDVRDVIKENIRKTDNIIGRKNLISRRNTR